MKKLIFLSCYFFSNALVAQTLPQRSENFFLFFQDFCRDSSFQIGRIKFPLISLYPDPSIDSTVTETIKQTEWYFVPIKDFTSNTFEYFFDGFANRELPESDEMVYAIIGIENGIQINYYFKRIEGKWYLLKIEDLST
jgi:hypothetical protein